MGGPGGHREHDVGEVDCAVLTVSDTRTEATDSSGLRIRALIEERGHKIAWYGIVPDDAEEIRDAVRKITQTGCARVIIAHGGTGISGRDRTYEVARELIAKELPGFGEIFRMLSYQQIGAAAMLSRATAGVTREGVALFVLPGSEKAVELAVSRLIAPELGHMIGLLAK